MDLRKQFQDCEAELDRMTKDLQGLEKNPSSFTMFKNENIGIFIKNMFFLEQIWRLKEEETK